MIAYEESINVDLLDSFIKVGIDLQGLSSLQFVSQTSRGDSRTVTLRDSSDQEYTVSYEEFLAKRASYLGGFQEGAALVSGEIAYRSTTVDGLLSENTIQFATVVWFYNKFRPIGGAPKPPSFQYGTRFEVDGVAYERQVNISHEIKPGESDRFTIKIGVDKSSYHRFRLKLLYNNSESIKTKKINLAIFVQRTDSKYIKGAATARASEPFSARAFLPKMIELINSDYGIGKLWQ